MCTSAPNFQNKVTNLPTKETHRLPLVPPSTKYFLKKLTKRSLQKPQNATKLDRCLEENTDKLVGEQRVGFGRNLHGMTRSELRLISHWMRQVLRSCTSQANITPTELYRDTTRDEFGVKQASHNRDTL